ncbi:MAG TPA: PASTA domain-containing protein, partial [Rugosimonospora sp.]|nr:PASTA domain-containing protein [Rugosimonospora sp.]
REEERSPYVPPPPRVMGNRNTGTMARVGNSSRRRASTWVLVALSLLGLLAVVALGTGIYLANHTTTVAVPDLKGGTPDQARTLLSNAKLTGDQQPVTADNCTRNTVVSQTPDAQAKVDEGTKVTFYVCQGPGDVTIPTGLKGKLKSDVEAQLTALGLKFTEVPQDSDQPKDTVLDLSPAEGTALEKGNTVTLMVSLGNLVMVPDVRTLSQEAAVGQLHKYGFTKIKFADKYTTKPQEVGIVLDQDPDGNTLHKTSDTITLFIGSSLGGGSPSPSPSASASTSG